MNILAIDTSTEACSAALRRADGRVFSEFEVVPRQHTRLLPQMMGAVLAAANISRQSLTHCAFANGPGAFTGIRIAAATAQGIGLALNIPVVTVSTLATLAQTCFDLSDCNRTLVALDARMGEIYWASYIRNLSGIAELRGFEQLSNVSEFAIPPEVDCGVGHGWSVITGTHAGGIAGGGVIAGTDAGNQQDGTSGSQAGEGIAGTHAELAGAIINIAGTDAGILTGTQAAIQPGRASWSVDADLLPQARSMLKLVELAIENQQMGSAENVQINYLRNKVAVKSQPK